MREKIKKGSCVSSGCSLRFFWARLSSNMLHELTIMCMQNVILFPFHSFNNYIVILLLKFTFGNLTVIDILLKYFFPS